MKKLFSFFIAAMVLISSAAFSSPSFTEPVKKVPNANNILIPVAGTDKKISLKELATISRSELESLTGKKMNVLEKIAFKKTQKRLNKGMDKNGNITDKKLLKAAGGESGFHLGGFALGFLLGLIGVLLAYVVFNDDYKKNRIKWSWIGLAANVLLSIILIAAVFSSVK